jgi:transcriptional regulator with XRE-family HTH domain
MGELRPGTVPAAAAGHFAVLLRGHRQAAGLTQEELAERSGLSTRALSNMECGRTRPHARSARLIAVALGLAGPACEALLRAAGEPGLVLAAAPGAPGALESGLAVPRQLPRAARHFVGRCAELDALTTALERVQGTPPDPACVVCVLAGPPGAGKTALAVHAARRVAHHFTGGQLYLDLRGFDPSGSPMPAGQAVQTLLHALGVPAPQVPGSVDARIGLYRSLLAQQKVLIVLDNARAARQVRPLLPASSGCAVLVTSRCTLTGLVATECAELVTLGPLTTAEAREMMAARLGAERAAREAAAISELIRLCGRLPLTMSIALARAAARPAFPISALVAGLREPAERLDGLDTGDEATCVRAVFSWSYQGLSEPAARMFRIISRHPGRDLTPPEAAALAVVTVPQARRHLRELAEANLLTETAPGRYAMHDLLRAYAAEQSAPLDATRPGTAARERCARLPRRRPAAQGELTHRRLGERVQAGHLAEQPGVAGAQRARRQPHARRRQVHRLVQHADILQGRRVGNGPVLPAEPGEAR